LQAHNKVGIGTNIREDEGCFVLAKTNWFLLIVDVDIGEAMGLFLALKWVQDLQLPNIDIDFELDSKRVVDKFHCKKVDIYELGAIRQIFNSYFTNSHFDLFRDK
jgi:hypothetical protein